MVTLESQISWAEFSLEQWVKEHEEFNQFVQEYLNLSLEDYFQPLSEVTMKTTVETLSLLKSFTQDKELMIAQLMAQDPRIQLEKLSPHLQEVLREYQRLHQALQFAQLSTESIKENTRKMLITLVNDPRLVVLFLCHVLSLLRHTELLSLRQVQNLAQASIEIYAPIANRLGIGQVRWEIEDLAFKQLYTEDYYQLSGELAQSRAQRESYVKKTIEVVENLLKENAIEAVITGRPKHFYSIWKKMSKKNKKLSEIFDLHAIRILVEDDTECYRALGLIHNQWTYIPEEFDDYIAHPKDNGYQSIHTAVMGPESKVIEVQIRSHRMHAKAELGIAAHWVYKDQKSHQADYQQKLETLRTLLKRSADQGSESFENVKDQIFGDRTYVFTPKGDVYDLPFGATGIDLAYLIHTSLGHSCSGVKINNNIQPLSTPLKNGDVVEILKSKKDGPSRDWLNASYGYIKTSRARQKITHWFRSLDKENLISDGKLYLEKELSKVGIALKEVQEKLVLQLKVVDLQELFFLAALGELKITRILDLLDQKREKKRASRLRPAGESVEQIDNSIGFYQVEEKQIKYDFAKCCQPSCPDPIVGVITRGKGVSIHQSDCPNLKGTPYIQDRLIGVFWKKLEREDNQQASLLTIEITAINVYGLVNQITSILLKEQITIDYLSTKTIKENHLAIVQISFQDKGYCLLHHLIDKLMQQASIIEVKKV